MASTVDRVKVVEQGETHWNERGVRMADEYRKELVSRSGRIYVSTSERETNDLMYGQGYREADAQASSGAEPAKPAPAEAKPAATPPKEAS